MKIILLTITLLLTGCGFHLSGKLPLAPNLLSLYIETKDPYGILTKNLTIFLHAANVDIKQKSNDAKLILEILSETTSERMIAINPKQNTRVYELLLTVIFQVKNPQGKIFVSPQVITRRASLTIQYAQILAGSNQANNIYQQLRQKIIYDIMDRLASKDITEMINRSHKT